MMLERCGSHDQHLYTLSRTSTAHNTRLLSAMLTSTLPALRRAPFALRRPFSSSSLLRPASSTLRTPLSLLRNQLIVRGAASNVSGRPGSQTVGHAAQNIREEVGGSAADLAKAIAGGNVFADGVEPTQQTFVRRGCLVLLRGPDRLYASSGSRTPSPMRCPSHT